MLGRQQDVDSHQVMGLIEALTREIVAAVSRGEDADPLRDLHDQARGFVMSGDLNTAKVLLTSKRPMPPSRRPQPAGKVVSIEVIRRRAQAGL